MVHCTGKIMNSISTLDQKALACCPCFWAEAQSWEPAELEQHGGDGGAGLREGGKLPCVQLMVQLCS